MNAIDTIFYLAILLMSVVVNEVSHGFMAEYFGDRTARDAGRLTLNPLNHLDPFGSVILPILLFISTGSTGHPIVFGWAKPVPYNPHNLRNEKWGSIAVAAAGVLSNIFLALVFGLILRFSISHFGLIFRASGFITIVSFIVITNLALAIFNLIPVPPLDGSKIIFPLFPRTFYPLVEFIERYSLFLLLIFIFFFSQWLVPVIMYFYSLLTGLAF